MDDPAKPRDLGALAGAFDADDAAGPDDLETAKLRARVDKALELTRDFSTPEEQEEHRRMLFSLARTHPRLSRWLEDRRPRAVPDESGLVKKKDEGALETSIARRAARGGRKA